MDGLDLEAMEPFCQLKLTCFARGKSAKRDLSSNQKKKRSFVRVGTDKKDQGAYYYDA